MEEKSSSSRAKYAMTYGAIIGLIIVVFMIVLYITDQYFNKGLGLVQYIVLIVGIYMSTKAYRDKILGGYISYGKALMYGLFISIFVGIITVFFNFILLRYDPGLVDKYMAIMEETFQNGFLGRMIPADQMDETLEKARESLTSVWSILSGVFVFSVIGFVISLITSAFLKRDPSPFA